jgi:hypothetical protein
MHGGLGRLLEGSVREIHGRARGSSRSNALAPREADEVIGRNKILQTRCCYNRGYAPLFQIEGRCILVREPRCTKNQQSVYDAES